MPRVDSGSCFGRLLDWERGGHCSIEPADADFSSFRSYLDVTMVLSTTVSGGGGEARILDCFAIPGRPGETGPIRLLRIVDGLRGLVRLHLRIAPRFDYGEVQPWIRYHGRRLHSAVGGSDGLLIYSDVSLDRADGHDLTASFQVQAQERIRLSLEYVSSTSRFLERGDPHAEDLDEELEGTIRLWRQWSRQIHAVGRYGPGMARSALVLKALANPLTGAIAAAPTTSLPEELPERPIDGPGTDRRQAGMNWDYRYSWVRDSAFSVRALAAVGCFDAAAEFRRFIEISAAGAADDLQIMYGVGGERRLTEIELPLHGYRGARPVRIGNRAAGQRQLDVYGELLELTWRWHEQGHSPDDDYWRFLLGLVERAAARWREPDRGLWESRGEPRHYVHSKVMLWAALDKGIRLAEECMRRAPVDRWKRTRREIRKAVEEQGYDRRRNTFVQAFGSRELDAALLLLPSVGFVEAADPRMVGTVDAIRAELDADGLLLRNRTEGEASGEGKGGGREGCFIACTFWLAECLAEQGRIEEARQAFDRAAMTSNDLGLFAEEFDTRRGEMAGNFPQALTHLSHISAAVALNRLSTGTAAE
jgi:GH15 family glucan-1,4-alpha-glucosidase